MGVLADAFTAALSTAAPDKDDVAALGAAIEAYIAGLSVFDLAGMPLPADLTGKAGYLLVVNDAETGFALVAP